MAAAGAFTAAQNKWNHEELGQYSDPKEDSHGARVENEEPAWVTNGISEFIEWHVLEPEHLIVHVVCVVHVVSYELKQLREKRL